MKRVDERLADLLLWWANGAVQRCDASEVRADTEVSIGGTNSKRALGFIVKLEERRAGSRPGCRDGVCAQ